MILGGKVSALVGLIGTPPYFTPLIKFTFPGTEEPVFSCPSEDLSVTLEPPLKLTFVRLMVIAFKEMLGAVKLTFVRLMVLASKEILVAFRLVVRVGPPAMLMSPPATMLTLEPTGAADTVRAHVLVIEISPSDLKETLPLA